MPRKVTIGKDMILENALQMLIEEGYAAVNVKSLSKRIGCSTQPLLWHFENMEDLRKELFVYAREYALKKASIQGKEGAEAFEHMGRAYIKMAMKEPNLFKFLYLGESAVSAPMSVMDMAGIESGGSMVEGISGQTGLTVQQTLSVIRNTIMYTHGIAAMIATGVFKASEKQIMAMVKSASEAFVIKESVGNE